MKEKMKSELRLKAKVKKWIFADQKKNLLLQKLPRAIVKSKKLFLLNFGKILFFDFSSIIKNPRKNIFSFFLCKV